MQNNSSAAQVDTHEDCDPYPLWQRPTADTTSENSPRTSSSPGVLTSSSIPSSPRTTPTEAPPAVALTGRTPCQYPACQRYARYGPQDGPLSACQDHKRVGQYTTNRHGVLLIATRDGKAFRTPAVTATGSSLGNNTSVASGQAPSRSTTESDNSSSSRHKAAKPSSTSVQKLKRANRPGLSIENDDERPASQRPCLFPGCNAGPEYGLPGAARAVYCFSHKKGPMVQVFQETLGLQDKGKNPNATAAPLARTVTGDISGTGTNAQAAAVGAAGNKKMPRTPKPVDKNGAKKARRGPKVIEENSMSSEHNSKKNPGNGVRNALVERNVAGGGPTITGREQGPVSKTASPRVSASTSGTTTMPPSPPNNRSTDASGMAPSAEMLLVRQAREAAKKEAETAGSGRRPRAPSRRALEASGRMKDQGAQWMTREKKAEETRVKTELREQRKQCKAAGLKFGVVLEAFVEGTAGAAVIGADAGGCKGGGEDDGGAGPPRNGAGWHKVSPVLL